MLELYYRPLEEIVNIQNQDMQIGNHNFPFRLKVLTNQVIDAED